ncbi:MAG: type II toxin-antitoxin system VapC family toxin [Nitrospiraceae bacterium]
MVAGSASTAFFSHHAKVGLDTNILIYFVQAHPKYGAWCASLFDRIERGRTAAVTSTVSLLEALVQPYALQDDHLIQTFYALLPAYPGMTWLPLDLDIADKAAELRARYRLSTPDAIHVATAIEGRATGFIGNDKGIKKVREIECVTLDDLI